jgi:hypothetical protein
MKPSGPSGSVTAAAVVGILIAAFGILTALTAVAGLSVMAPPNTAALPPFAKSLSIVMMLVFCGIAIFGIITGLGVLKLRNWARISMLVWGGVMGFFCGIALAFLLFVPLPEGVENSPLAPNVLRLVVSLAYGVPVAIGIWWLWLFNQSSVKEQFLPTGPAEGAALVAPVARCPLPLAILAGFSIFSVGISVLLFPAMHLPFNMIVFGFRFHGIPGAVVFFLSSALFLTGSIGMLRLKRWSYPLLLAQYFFWMASGTISLLSPNFERNVQAIFSQMNLPEGPAAQAAFVQTRTFGILTLLPSVLLVWLLLYFHTRFMEACAAKEELENK